MTTYFIAKNGQDSDAWPGDSSRPWLTWNYALQRGGGGNTYIGGDGVYGEALRNVIPSGSPGAPTVLKALNPRGVILRPGDRQFYVVQMTNPGGWIVIDGIDADGAGVTLYGSYYFQADSGEISNVSLVNGVARGCINDGTYGPVGISLGGHHNVAGHHHFEVLGMESSGHVNQNNVGPGDGYGLYLSCSDVLVKGCRLTGNGGYQLHKYTTSQAGVDRCIITENFIDGSATNKGQAAVILSGGKDNRFFKNYVIGSRTAAGVDLAYSENNTVVEENVIRNSAWAAVRILDLAQPPWALKVINNQFDGNNPDAVQNDVPGSAEIYGNTVGGVIIPPIPPDPPVEKKTKKIKFQGSLTIQVQGEVTIVEETSSLPGSLGTSPRSSP